MVSGYLWLLGVTLDCGYLWLLGVTLDCGYLWLLGETLDCGYLYECDHKQTKRYVTIVTSYCS